MPKTFASRQRLARGGVIFPATYPTEWSGHDSASESIDRPSQRARCACPHRPTFAFHYSSGALTLRPTDADGRPRIMRTPTPFSAPLLTPRPRGERASPSAVLCADGRIQVDEWKSPPPSRYPRQKDFDHLFYHVASRRGRRLFFPELN